VHDDVGQSMAEKIASLGEMLQNLAASGRSRSSGFADHGQMLIESVLKGMTDYKTR